MGRSGVEMISGRGSWLRAAAIGLVAVAWPSMPVEAQEGRHHLLVSSRNTHSVKRFDAETGAYLGDFIRSGAGGLDSTQEVLLAPNGNLLVSGRGNASILEFDGGTGEFIGPFTSGYALDNPTKMSWGPDGRLYVSQWGSARSSVAAFGPSGVFEEEVTPALNQPQQHLWDDQGRLYVVSFGGRDVRRFRDGALVDVFVPPGTLGGPVNLWWHSSGDLLVADWESGTVQRFEAATGKHLGAFITGIARPEGWAIGPDGALYIAEWAGNRIARFDAETGARLGVAASGGGMAAPNGLLFVPAEGG